MSAAETAYASQRAEAQDLIERLSQALDAHTHNACGNPDLWGYVGDLGAFNARLYEALGRVGGLSAAEKAQHEV